MSSERVLVQIASYNTNLQGHQGVPQDLVDWLSPTLQTSTFLSRSRTPDIIAVGFQELLPLHLGLAGLSSPVMKDRAGHIQAQIEANSPDKEKFSLIARVDNVGVALLVYAKDEGISRNISDVQTAWTGCGPFFMGNKGAVGIRFTVRDTADDAGEIYTFVCAHLTAHPEKLQDRLWDYNHISRSLLFPPIPGSTGLSTMFDTSHLFYLGDLNFRLDLPTEHPLTLAMKNPRVISNTLEPESFRKDLKEHDQLLNASRNGTAFTGFREGDFWKFKCSYKYELGKVDEYSHKRLPAWTDRILYTTHSDSADTPDVSNITNLLYTSIVSYTTSDHKPIVSLLLLPTRQPASSIPLLAHIAIKPDPWARAKRYHGRCLDRLIGVVWWIFTLLGAGSAVFGTFNFLISLLIGSWSLRRWVST